MFRFLNHKIFLLLLGVSLCAVLQAQRTDIASDTLADDKAVFKSLLVEKISLPAK